MRKYSTTKLNIKMKYDIMTNITKAQLLMLDNVINTILRIKMGYHISKITHFYSNNLLNCSKKKIEN